MATRGSEPSCRDAQCDAAVPVPGDACPRCGTLQRAIERPDRAQPAQRHDVAGSIEPVDVPEADADPVEADDAATPAAEATAGEWTSVVHELLDRPHHDEIEISKDDLPDPARSGFTAARGKPVGQLADYRLVLEDGGCVHVREFEDRYAVHRDRVAPSVSRLGHLCYDMPVETSAVAAFLAVALVRRAAPRTLGVARRAALALSSVRGDY